MPYMDNGVGYQKTDTSRDAAASVKPRNLREAVLGILSAGNRMTTEEIADALEKPYVSVQPRLSELRNDGKVIDTGARRLSKWGKQAIVWGKA